jgi:DNA-binding transcriptional regulator YiaG
MAKRRPVWDARRVRALREHLGLTQQELARELGTRQQTISEWETGVYQPRGLSERFLSLVAEQAGFAYGAESPASGPEER